MVEGIVSKSGHSPRHELSRLMAEYTRRILHTQYWGDRESFALQMINANRDVAEKYKYKGVSGTDAWRFVVRYSNPEEAIKKALTEKV